MSRVEQLVKQIAELDESEIKAFRVSSHQRLPGQFSRQLTSHSLLKQDFRPPSLQFSNLDSVWSCQASPPRSRYRISGWLFCGFGSKLMRNMTALLAKSDPGHGHRQSSVVTKRRFSSCSSRGTQPCTGWPLGSSDRQQSPRKRGRPRGSKNRQVSVWTARPQAASASA